MSDLTKFNAWDKAIKESSQGDWADEARECFALTAGDQVSEEDRRRAAEAGVLYAIFNKIDSTVSAICGSEVTNRQEVRYYPRQATVESAAVNEVLTSAAEWTRDECDAGDEESEAFRDAIVCGMGWAETRMSYDVDPDGMPVTERVDPLEMRWDPSARRPNLADARYLRRKRRFSHSEAEERFGIDASLFARAGRGEDVNTRYSDDEPYSESSEYSDERKRRDEIEVTEYQWFELEPRVRVADPSTGELVDLTPEQYEQAAEMLAAMGGAEGVRYKARVYRRAYRIDDTIVQGPEPIPGDEFLIKAITGKLDRNKGIWYGVVRAMRDPQRLLNKQITQLQRIIDASAKGGLLVEQSAFADPEQARQDWAASDTMIFMQDGAIAAGRVMPKPVGQYPPAIDRMLAVTMEMVPAVSGVNNEMMGVIDREQAGVVDWQRKQAAYGVLGGYFNSLRRYRRMQGRLLLKLITEYMSDGRLVRVQGKTGDIRYVQLAKQPDTTKYDVIVDEAPSGPNQKERTFLFLTQFAPTLARLGLPPQVWLKMMEYSPLPASLVSEVQQMMQSMPPPPDPKAQAMQQKMQMDSAVAQQKMQQSLQEAQIAFELRQRETAAELQMKREAAQIEAQQAARDALVNQRIREMEVEGNLRIQEQKMQFDAMMAQRQFEFEARMQEREAEFNERIRRMEVEIGQRGASGGRGAQFGGDVG